MYKLKLNASRLADESGRVRLKVVLWIVFTSLAIYGAILVVPQYVSYKMLQYEVRGEADVAHMYTDAQIESRILSKAASWSIDLDQYDIEVIRDYEDIDISISYGVGVVFFGRYEYVFNYDIYVTKPLQET
ncbi:hypothetical protein MNBD_DELTA01-1943 [hydrothermal vent metagenome]|uniref:DUF4845 domain-containing protein n=1 Tax=hydrothermal vent metagenome TaxID=652676 RepID=A0A3B0QTM3_9ZZZZ